MVILVSLIPIPLRITAASQEIDELVAYPQEDLASVIKEVGFSCTLCGKCCTRAFNGHVFLLDKDAAAVKEIDPKALEPAPFPEFCDQNGVFYVSGYALKAQEDDLGTCYFLKNGRCKVYDRRFSICRIYPYMLHREPDEHGKVDWRQVSGLGEHGEYEKEIPDDETAAIAAETKEYEEAYLRQELAFLRFMKDHFAKNNLRHVQKIYDDRLRAFHKKGTALTVEVFCDGKLEEHRMKRDDLA